MGIMTILKGSFIAVAALVWLVLVLKANDVETLYRPFWRALGAAALVQAVTLIWLCFSIPAGN